MEAAKWYVPAMGMARQGALQHTLYACQHGLSATWMRGSMAKQRIHPSLILAGSQKQPDGKIWSNSIKRLRLVEFTSPWNMTGNLTLTLRQKTGRYIPFVRGDGCRGTLSRQSGSTLSQDVLSARDAEMA